MRRRRLPQHPSQVGRNKSKVSFPRLWLQHRARNVLKTPRRPSNQRKSTGRHWTNGWNRPAKRRRRKVVMKSQRKRKRKRKRKKKTKMMIVRKKKKKRVTILNPSKRKLLKCYLDNLWI